MRIASWNVNSIRVRLANVTRWIENTRPDVLLLQEIKCETKSFPKLEFEALGYACQVVGQKTYNGVAILSRYPMTDIIDKLPGDTADTQARYLEATVQNYRVSCIYLPNGNPIESEKFTYKLTWMDRLKQHIQNLVSQDSTLIIGGDFNVVPAPMDAYDPKSLERDALFHPTTKKKYRELCGLGLTDAYRALHPENIDAYTFWDYQGGAWQRNLGLRIDHFLLSPRAASRIMNCDIDTQPRGEEKASDHAPIMLSLT